MVENPTEGAIVAYYHNNADNDINSPAGFELATVKEDSESLDADLYVFPKVQGGTGYDRDTIPHETEAPTEGNDIVGAYWDYVDAGELPE